MNRQDELIRILADVQFEDYVFHFENRGDHFVLFAKYRELDIVTHEETWQTTRKWFISRFVSKSELVQSAFKLCITSMEHRTREAFKYRGKRVFGPHFDVDALWDVCNDKKFDYRLPHLQDGHVA